MTECAPCLVENKILAATNWCMECQEPICSECTERHKLFSGLKAHQISTLQCTAHIDVTVVSDKLCKTHPWTELDFYCPGHDTICCRICLTTEHKQCTNIQSLESASAKIKQSALFADCNDKLTAISKCIDSLWQIQVKKSTDVENDDKKIQNAIREISKELTCKIQQTEQKMLNDLQKTTDQLYLNLQRERESVLKKKKELELYKNRMDFANKHASNKQSFFYIRDITQDLMRMENELEKLIHSLSNKTSISFEQSNVMNLSNLSTFGTINVTIATCPAVTYISLKQQRAQTHQQTPDKSRITELTKINAKWKVPDSGDRKWKDGNFGEISRFSITDDEKIIWCSIKKTMVCMIYPSGSFNNYKEINIHGEPIDITIVPSTDTAVATIQPAFIQFIDLKYFRLNQRIDVTSALKNTTDVVCGICSTKQKILVGGKGIICILDVEGRLQNTLELRCGIINSIHVGNDTNYYISELSQCYCIKPNGKTVFTYSIPGEQSHVALKTDLSGSVYVMGRDTNTIQRLHPNGFLNCRFLGNENGINSPIGMCFNKSCDKLYVANANEVLFLSLKRKT